VRIGTGTEFRKVYRYDLFDSGSYSVQKAYINI
jgi:hypothetical protein